METDTNRSDAAVAESEPGINEQISSIINEKFNESLDQIQNDPSALKKKSFFSGFWKSVMHALKEQLESIGRGFYAAMIAVIVAIVTPIIINSNLLSKLELMNQKIESVLPSEQDKENQRRILEAINIQTTLKENDEPLEKQLAEKPILLEADFDKRFVEVEQTVVVLKEQMETLRQQEELLNKKFEQLNLSGFNISPFLKRLDELKQRGVGLEKNISNNSYNKAELDSWLKTVYYLAGSVPFGKESSFDGASLLEESMRTVIEAKNDFREPKRRIAETLVVLDSIELLAISGLIANQRYAGKT